MTSQRSMWLGLGQYTMFLVAAVLPAYGSQISIGTLSFDTFIPPVGNSAGVYAFDIANFTDGFDLPPDFPVSDSLTLQSAVLTLTLIDSSQQVFDLGDITPGFLLDGSGNPVVQVPSTESFVSAELTATLSATTFMLFDGSTFNGNSGAIDTLLLPSSGPTLTVDVDNTTINVSSAPASSVPEPGSAVLALAGGLVLIVRRVARLKERL